MLKESVFNLNKIVMNQKERSKRYKHLHGKEIDVYVGQVPCEMKHIEFELSVNPKTNKYGKYKPITVVIRRTHFNGKVILLTVDGVNTTYVRPFYITIDELEDMCV